MVMPRGDPDTSCRREDRAILLLGAAVRPGGEPSPALARRTQEAARLWHAGAAGVVVPCGGVGAHPPAEAEVMCRLLRVAGVAAEALHPETGSTSTAENVAFALPILQELGLHEVLIVTDAYHLPRAALIARRAGLMVETAAPPWRDASVRAQLKGAAREVPAYLAAWLGLRPPGRRD